jgi:hypothetical protein
MKLRYRLLLAVFGFFSAVLILSLSLTSFAMSAQSSVGVLDRSFAMDKKILPDHISYPFLMLIDRVRLESASPIEKIYLMTQYANRRLIYATELLNQERHDLAVTTLTKSQKYLLYAGGEVLNNNREEKYRLHVANTIEYHLKFINNVFQDQALSDEERAVIDKLNEELLVIQNELR